MIADTDAYIILSRLEHDDTSGNDRQRARTDYPKESVGGHGARERRRAFFITMHGGR